MDAPVRLTELTVSTEAPVLSKSRIDPEVTLRLPNVSVVPFSMRLPPASVMLRPESLKLAPSVSVDPLPTTRVPVPASVPLSELAPDPRVSDPPEPDEGC